MKKGKHLFIKNLRLFFLICIIALGLMMIVGTGSGGGGDGDKEIFGLVDNTLLDSTPDWIQAPVVAMNDEGTIITSYTKYDSTSEIVYGLYTRLWRKGVWENPVVISEQIRKVSYLNHQITINESDKAGLIYVLPGFDFDAKFGVAYFDGSTWNYNISIEGDMVWSISRYMMGMDSKGVLYVAYQIWNPDYSCDLVVARFNKTGLIDKTYFPNTCGTSILLSINKKDEVMVLLSNIGSRIFDGTSWGELVPLSDVGPGYAFLKFYDSGEADFVTLDYQMYHYHYDGSSWGTGQLIVNGTEEASAAASDSGTIMIAYRPPSGNPPYHIEAKFYDGTSWGPPSIVDDDDLWEGDPRALVDGAGNFVVIWEGIVANYFDDAWHEPVVLDGVTGVLKPAMAMNDKGDFTIINCAGINENLYGMRFFFRPAGIIPDIKANGSDGPISISTSDTLSVTIELQAGDWSGEDGDWWVLAITPYGWYYYHLSTYWLPGIFVTYQGPLGDVAPYEVLNYAGLPMGSYIFYFGVDTIMNGFIDVEPLYYDSVDVTITP